MNSAEPIRLSVREPSSRICMIVRERLTWARPRSLEFGLFLASEFLLSLQVRH